MRRLKGALRLSLKQDITYVFLPIILTCIFFYIDYLDIKVGMKTTFEITDYIRNVSFMVFADYIFSFSIRYVIYSNFSSSRKLFFRSIKTMSFIKSFILSLFGVLLLILVEKFYVIKGVKYSITIFGQEYQHITLLLGLALFVALFIFILLMYSISILVASINKLTILLLIVCNTIMCMISDIIFNEALLNYYYYIIAVIFILLVVVTLKISWTVLKKKVDIRSSFFQKWCENFSPNCEK